MEALNRWMNIQRHIIVLCGIIPGFLWGQEVTCEQVLNLASAEFQAGRFNSVPAMLVDCIQSGFTREQLQRAYLLLTEVYLILNDPIAAETSYLEVLRANPEYSPNPQNDPIDLVYLSKKFTASPVFSAFARVGLNVSPVRIIYWVPAYSGSVPEKTSYSLRQGIQLVGGFDWHVAENISIMTEVAGLSLTAFKRERSHMFGGLDNEIYTASQVWLNNSVSVKYTLSRFFHNRPRKFVPQVYAGIASAYLLSDKGTIQSFNNDPSESEGFNTIISNSPTLNFLPYRNRFNPAVIMGAMVRYKWKLEYFFADIRYGFGMLNLTRPSSTFSGMPAQEYGHVNDYFRLDNLALSVGFVHPFYKPRKISGGRTKRVLKQVKKMNHDQ